MFHFIVNVQCESAYTIIQFSPAPPPPPPHVPTDPPAVTLSPVPSTQHRNTPLILSCGFDANPTPNITWLFNGTELVITPLRLSVNMTGNVSVLQFSSLEGTDTGEYSCMADNGIGSPATSGNALIIVQGEGHHHTTHNNYPFLFLIYLLLPPPRPPGPPYPVPPDPVQGLQSTGVTMRTISIMWSFGFDGRESIDNTTVYYAASSNNDNVSEVSVRLSVVTSYELMGLQPLTNYTISVVAINAVGPSNPTSITVETLPLCKCMQCKNYEVI